MMIPKGCVVSHLSHFSYLTHMLNYLGFEPKSNMYPRYLLKYLTHMLSHRKRSSICSVFFYIEGLGFESPSAHSGAKTACRLFEGNLPMKTMFSIVKFRGRGT